MSYRKRAEIAYDILCGARVVEANQEVVILKVGREELNEFLNYWENRADLVTDLEVNDAQTV